MPGALKQSGGSDPWLPQPLQWQGQVCGRAVPVPQRSLWPRLLRSGPGTRQIWVILTLCLCSELQAACSALCCCLCSLLRRNWFPSAFLSFADVKARVEARHRSVSKLRPRVYVYELPSHLLAGLFQHRRTLNDTEAQSRFLEPLLFLESLLASDYRTVDPQEADFFFVPIFPQ